MISITLPMPIALNNSYINVTGRGRVPAKKLVAWKKAAGWELVAQRPKPISGWVNVEIEIKHPGAKVRTDVDGRIKCVLDLITSHKLIEDDSKVARVTAAWSFEPDCPECRVVVASVQCMPFGHGGSEVSLKQLENLTT